ncbi:metal ABC transporter permease [Gulosibacter molinativorax]|uniref:Metal ABC transporter permease n=1 Tax=Gulosibacter molinativorax TaxID=256821 RepID=A0ABT7CAT0_9MICO|nr:metal ABC transporter permease [Gulosibacter molinativorax]MDJ1371746.1 metal ABC transporter permease [Gulosibacter molinativorax]QUY63168.1 Chelated iron transport system membrane protein yfeD [Gulosibacter molinativorax]
MTVFTTALITGILVGALAGLVGTIVVLRQRAFFTVALTHATFPGGVAAALLGVNIVFGAAVFGLGLVALMLALGRIRRQGRQVAAGIVLSFGYALGTFLHSMNPQLQTRVDSFLTGQILGISPENVGIIAGMLVIAIVTVGMFWKEILFSTFDRVGFEAAGYRESRMEVLTLVLIAGTVVATMPAIGSILAIAMIAAPAAAARLVTQRIQVMVPLAMGLGVVSAVLGLFISRWFDIAAGGSMALTATAIFLLAMAWSGMRKWFRRSRSAEAVSAQAAGSREAVPAKVAS